MDDDTAAETVKDFLQKWDRIILPHFKLEEKHLLPAFIALAGNNHEHVVRLLQEHEQIESMATKLETIQKQNTLDLGFIKNLGTLLEQHIRFEERTFFNELEKDLDSAKLQAIGESLAAECVTFENS